MTETRKRSDAMRIMEPMGLSSSSAFEVFMRQVWHAERQWLEIGGWRVPYWCMAGKNVIGGKTYAILDALDDDQRHCEISSHAFHSVYPIDGSFATSCLVETSHFQHRTNIFVVNLSRTVHEARSVLDKKWRNQLKKAEQVDTAFVVLHADELESWYALYSARMHEKGSMPRSIQYLRSFYETMGDAVLFVGLKYEGHLVSAGLGYIDDRYATVLWQTSEKTAWPWCVNNLFYWRLIEYLISRNVRLLDLGPTAVRDTRNAHFKLGMGARAIPVWHVRPSIVSRIQERIRSVKRRFRMKFHQ